ncbi:MAG: hypothetical protein ACI837_001695 [Crocinitomicaceae bacterium]|jgi:hypothetical protein
MTKWIFIVFLGIAFSGNAQDSLQYTWKEKSSFPLDSSSTWSVDQLENHYVSSNGSIHKYDSTGLLRFVQSVKSYGDMTALVPINAMKLVHFSEEQQTVCFFDNTLTAYQDCIDLLEGDILNASLVCASSQSDRLWILDQLNSTLHQIAFGGNNVGFAIDNLAGILDMNRVAQILESGEKLYMLDQLKGIYVFDIYGSFIDLYAYKNIEGFDVLGNTLFMLENDRLILTSIVNDESIEIVLPVKGVFQFKTTNNGIFLRTPESVHKFELQFTQ